MSNYFAGIDTTFFEYTKNRIIKLVEYFSNAVCLIKIVNKIGYYIMPKSRVFYLRQK